MEIYTGNNCRNEVTTFVNNFMQFCGHSVKDHQIIHVEGVRTSYRYEEDEKGEGSSHRKVSTYKILQGPMVFCGGQNIGGINCTSESEKRLAQKVVLIKQNGIFFPSGDPYLHNIVKRQCKQFRPYKRNDGKEPTYRCSSCSKSYQSRTISIYQR